MFGEGDEQSLHKLNRCGILWRSKTKGYKPDHQQKIDLSVVTRLRTTDARWQKPGHRAGGGIPLQVHCSRMPLPGRVPAYAGFGLTWRGTSDLSQHQENPRDFKAFLRRQKHPAL